MENIPMENREFIIKDLEHSKEFAAKQRQYRVQSALVDAIAQLRTP